MNHMVDKGNLVLVEDGIYQARLQTCCGTIIYDRKGPVGITHTVWPMPFIAHLLLEKSDFKPEYVTNTSIRSLVQKLRDTGANGLYAIICGNQDEEELARYNKSVGTRERISIGRMNEVEAIDTLLHLGIPVTHNYSGKFYDTVVNLSRGFISLEFYTGVVRHGVIEFPLTQSPIA
jgi:hypothetical protein